MNLFITDDQYKLLYKVLILLLIIYVIAALLIKASIAAT